jgi:TonB family protein
MRNLFFLFTFVLGLTIPNLAMAQKPLIQEKDEVIKTAKAELDKLMQPGTSLREDAAKRKIKGEFIVDISIHKKGNILSVYMVSSDADDIPMQNRAKDLIKTIEFGFKMPKGKIYKFQYTFTFN